MVMVLAGPEDSGEFGLPFITGVGNSGACRSWSTRRLKILRFANVHLKRGADVVCYSGGKVLRGPQCAGVALGRKDLLEAAWVNSAPHHTFGRPMKVGREEIMGMLAAVDAWKRRDIKAEYATKRGYLQAITDRVQKVSTVRTEIIDSNELSNHAPRMRVSWDPAKVGLTGTDVAMLLFEGTPRIYVGPSNRNLEFPADSIGIGAHMMMPGDEKIVADRLFALLSNPPKKSEVSVLREPSSNVNGRWDVRIDFIQGSAGHVITLEQKGNQLYGTYFGEQVRGDLAGTMSGSTVKFRSRQRYEGTVLDYRFEGELTQNRIEGTVNLGEYGKARWTATKHEYGAPGPAQRPIKPA